MTIFERRAFISSWVLVLICAPMAFAATTLKIGSAAPDGTALMNELREAADRIEEATDGEVKFKFYAGGVMGDDFTVKRKIRARQLQGGVLLPSVYSSEVPDLNLYSLPMVFRDNEEVNAVRAEIDPVLYEELDEAGIVPLGLAGLGFAYAMGSKPALSVSDARSLKFWTPENNQGAEHTLRTIGIAPVPLTLVDVLPGLQTGLIDAIASPPIAAIALQWHTQIKYVLGVPLVYTFVVFVLDKRAFDKLDEEHQDIVLTEMREAIRIGEKSTISDHEVALDVLIEQGIELLIPDEEILDEWRETARHAVSQSIEEGFVTEDAYETLKTVLEKFRQENAE